MRFDGYLAFEQVSRMQTSHMFHFEEESTPKFLNPRTAVLNYLNLVQ